MLHSHQKGIPTLMYIWCSQIQSSEFGAIFKGHFVVFCVMNRRDI